MIVPIVVPVRRRADPLPPLSQKLLLIECLLVLEHEVDCSSQLMGKDREPIRVRSCNSTFASYGIAMARPLWVEFPGAECMIARPAPLLSAQTC